MHITSNAGVWAASSLLWAGAAWAGAAWAEPAPMPSTQLNQMTYKGCFSSSTPLTSKGPYQFQTQGYCQTLCAPLNKAVMGLTNGDECWCGDQLPPASAKVSDQECTLPCKGFNQNSCGGSNGKFTVYLTGTNNNVGSASGGGGGDDDDDNNNNNNHPASQQQATPPSKSDPPPKAVTQHPVTSIITLGGQTQTVTRADAGATGAPVPSPSKKAGPSTASTAGIAAGVVVGVVALGAAIGAAFFLLRRRKRRAVEEEYRRNAAVINFANNGKPDSASSIADSRLDPSVMMQRRMSDGSIADNQDYSRRILKVTNPDGT